MLAFFIFSIPQMTAVLSPMQSAFIVNSKVLIIPLFIYCITKIKLFLA